MAFPGRRFSPSEIKSTVEKSENRLQLFRERLSKEVHATIPKGIEFTVLQRNLKELHERPQTYVCSC